MIRRAILIGFAIIVTYIVIYVSSGHGEGEENQSVAGNFHFLLSHASSFDRGSLESPWVALTFDGGWKCQAAGPVLETLAKKGVRATFFLTGEFIERYPDLVRRIVAEGHEVGNHTYSHTRLTRPGVGRQRVQDELNRAHQSYYRVTGRKFAPFWRAPYRAQNERIRRWAAEAGYLHVGWTRGAGSRNMDTLDWVGNPRSRMYRSADEIAFRVVNFDGGKPGGANGAIILMHLGSTRSGDFPYERLGWIIAEMRRKGYEFVTISGMLRYLS